MWVDSQRQEKTKREEISTVYCLEGGCACALISEVYAGGKTEVEEREKESEGKGEEEVALQTFIGQNYNNRGKICLAYEIALK